MAKFEEKSVNLCVKDRTLRNNRKEKEVISMAYVKGKYSKFFLICDSTKEIDISLESEAKEEGGTV